VDGSDDTWPTGDPNGTELETADARLWLLLTHNTKKVSNSINVALDAFA
jgi:hypothetical protein